MDCDFSEFSYGYAAIREAEAELAQIYQSLGAPILPSLKQEEKLGYDARINTVGYCLFLQFKRVEYVSRAHPASPTWPAAGGRHFRFSIDSDGHQHQALVALETSLVGSAGDIYYTAPSFHRQREFDAAYGRGQVLEKSFLISPTEFPAMTGKHHFVANMAGDCQILSEPRRLEREDNWGHLRERARSRATDIAGRSPVARDLEGLTLGQLEEAVQESIGRLRRNIPREVDAPIVQRLHRSATALGCGLVLLVVDDKDQ